MERLDQYLVKKGHEASRERAKRTIQAGLVKINDVPVTKASFLVSDTDRIVVLNSALNLVSIGGEKLQRMLSIFNFSPAGKNGLDIGASTGGFTEVLLQAEADQILTIDIGTDQLHDRIRKNARVRVMESTDFRSLASSELPFPISFCVCDVSFISLVEILKHACKIIPNSFDFLGLIKPQFEQNQRIKTKKGIIKNEKIRQHALRKVITEATALGYRVDCQPEIVSGDGKTKNYEYGILLHWPVP